MELGPEDVSLLERCPHFRGCCVQASLELGPEDMSLLERCPNFRGCCVQASVELGPEDVSLLERCPHFRGCCVHRLQWSWDLKMCPYPLSQRWCYIYSMYLSPVVLCQVHYFLGSSWTFYWHYGEREESLPSTKSLHVFESLWSVERQVVG